MTTATMVAQRAEELGREDRQSYRAEFGTDPIEGEVGDWDATGVTEMWMRVGRETEVDVTSPEGQDLYQEARIAYLKALFATEDVA